MTSGTIDDLPAVLTPAMVCSYLAIETARPDGLRVFCGDPTTCLEKCSLN